MSESQGEGSRGDGLVASLIRGAGTFFAVQGVGMALGFAMNVLLARGLGAEGYGAFVLALAWIGAAGIFARAGFGTASVRFVSELRGDAEHGLLRGFLRTSSRTVLATSVGLAAFGALILLVAGERIPELLRGALWVGLLAVPVIALLEIASASLRGLLRGGTALVPGRIVQPGTVVLVLLAGWALGAAYSPAQAMAVYTGAGALALATAGVALRRALPGDVRAAPPRYARRLWMRTAAPLAMINALQFSLQRMDLLLIGLLLGSVSAGLYAPAVRIAALIDFCLVAVNWWAGPLIARTHRSGNRDELARLVRRAAQVTLAFTAVAVAGVLLFGGAVLGVFGAEFVAAETALRIRVVGSLANALLGPVGLLLTMTGGQDAAARVMGIYAVLGLVLNLVLLPWLGIEGAALAAAITSVGWNVHMAVVVYRRLGIRTTAF